MADYIVFKQKQVSSQQALRELGIKAWDILDLQEGFTADDAGALGAVKASYDGPGHYGVIRADNGRTGWVDLSDVSIDVDVSPEWRAPPSSF